VDRLIRNFLSPGGRGLKGGGPRIAFSPSPQPSPIKGEGGNFQNKKRRYQK